MKTVRIQLANIHHAAHKNLPASENRPPGEMRIKNAANPEKRACSGAFGTPGWARTSGLSLRRRPLYPTELRGHLEKIFNFPAQQDSNELPLRRRTLYPAEVQRPIYNFIYIIACLFCKGKRLNTTLGGDRSIRLSYGNTTLILYHGIMFCAIPLLLFYSVLCCKTAVSMSYRHGDSGFIGLKLSYCRAVQRSSLK